MGFECRRRLVAEVLVQRNDNWSGGTPDSAETSR